jgi:enoyl-CoA hydratase/carnithine racemase
MSKVKIESHADVAILRLSNGVTNAISPELVDDLADALDQAKEEFKGLILAGGSKFFSIGFDLPTLLQLDRPAMADFYFKFNRTALDLYTVPLPTASAIDGTKRGENRRAGSISGRFDVAPNRRRTGGNPIKLSR